ncbi:hypothetical protein J1G44_00340 [Cellulomonas sp. zg-ZUI199]|uniref:CU044_5270 family protein n=1 Tax=Cellulomonas wangleii TaxID=2816956 RepID=A0ABX8D1G6_9CELL|nr:hypothetical protein [Cellulomonas wangleii]MBO0922930.1 hypothetical protein [Cellulomonas wangleii]QVI61326.1 hypothetical protein KG103_12625 [Cellulomonas wangleii]
MTADEDIAQQLRDRVERVVPQVVVDVRNVVPRARRRRAVTWGTSAAIVLVAVVGTVWGASGAGLPQVVPAVPDGGTPAPSASPDAVGAAALVPPAVATVADDGTVTGVPGDPWDGDAAYWYVLAEKRTGEEVPPGPGSRSEHIDERIEWWTSRERPGLLVIDGDLGRAIGLGPLDVLSGTYLLDGVRYDALSDPRSLPTDPVDLTRAIADALPTDGPSRDDALFEQVIEELSHRGGLLRRDLRDAYWGVAALVPGTTSSTGQDSRGRAGEVLRRTAADGTQALLVRDPATGLLLESRSPQYDERTLFLEQRPVEGTPVAPSLEPLGCESWAVCARG